MDGQPEAAPQVSRRYGRHAARPRLHGFVDASEVHALEKVGAQDGCEWIALAAVLAGQGENLPPEGAEADATLRKQGLRLCQIVRAAMTRNRFSHTATIGIAFAQHDGHRTAEVWLILTGKRHSAELKHDWSPYTTHSSATTSVGAAKHPWRVVASCLAQTRALSSFLYIGHPHALLSVVDVGVATNTQTQPFGPLSDRFRPYRPGYEKNTGRSTTPHDDNATCLDDSLLHLDRPASLCGNRPVLFRDRTAALVGASPTCDTTTTGRQSLAP